MRADRRVAGVVLILVCGCLIALLTFGLRSSFALFTNAGRGELTRLLVTAKKIEGF